MVPSLASGVLTSLSGRLKTIHFALESIDKQIMSFGYKIIYR